MSWPCWSNLSDAIAMQALRPLSVTAALDRVLADPQWRDHVDASQIGGFGASLGGETMLLLGGAALTTSPACRRARSAPTRASRRRWDTCPTSGNRCCRPSGATSVAWTA